MSWVIILVFALGVGLAPVVERELRPIDYPNSETFKLDLVLAGLMVLLLAASCAAGRREVWCRTHECRDATEKTTVANEV